MVCKILSVVSLKKKSIAALFVAFQLGTQKFYQMRLTGGKHATGDAGSGYPQQVRVFILFCDNLQKI